MTDERLIEELFREIRELKTGLQFQQTLESLNYTDWAGWTPTYGGFSVDPSDVMARSMKLGSTRWCMVYMGTAGTSNATTFTMSAPVAAATGSGWAWRASLSFYEDNGTNYRNGGEVSIASGASTFNLYTPSTTWTSSGEKRAFFQIFYEV